MVGTCHVVQVMLPRESHKGDTILELVPNADNLMLVHVKIIVGIVMPHNELDEADRFG